MIKILYIISTLQKTGPVNVLYNIIKNLDRTKYEPVILTLSKEPEGSIKNKFEELNIRCYCQDLKGLKGYLDARKIKKIVNDIAPNIIHAHCFRSTLFTALYLSKKYKTISTIHCDYDVDFVMAYGKFIGSLMSFLMDFSLKRINIRLAVSELLCNLLKKKKNYELSYVNNGIDTEKFKPAQNKNEIRNKLDLPIDKRIWIWAGVMIERKNPLLLVDTIKKLNTDDIFVFCGDGNLYSEIKEQIKNLNNIILTGNVDNIDEYLQASDYYISTSLSEGLPMSVIEAMACGLPCILSDIEQHKFLIKDNNVGLIFQTNNEKDLLNKINGLLNIDYYETSMNARNIVLNNFSSLIMTKNYEKKYEELLKLNAK